MKRKFAWATLEIHILSWIVTIALDIIWSGVELPAIASVVGLLTVPGLALVIFGMCLVAVACVQHYIVRDDWGIALSKGVTLGIIAAIPLSFTSLLGGAFLGVFRLLTGLDKEVILLGKFTKEWRLLEGTLRSIAPPKVRRKSLFSVIKALKKQANEKNNQALVLLLASVDGLRENRNRIFHEETLVGIDKITRQISDASNALAHKEMIV